MTKLQPTKVFSKVLADGRNSAIMLSFSSSFRPNILVKHLPNHSFVGCNANKESDFKEKSLSDSIFH